MAIKKIQYYVEGECEKKLIDEIKKSPYYQIRAGKVTVFNFINNEIENDRIALLDPKTIIILVYDIDIDSIDILYRNVKKLETMKFKVVHIQSIRNFEDEIVYSTSLNDINDMFNTQSKKEFKKEFLRQKDLMSKLKKVNFDHKLIWTRTNDKKPFCVFSSKKDLDFIKEK